MISTKFLSVFKFSVCILFSLLSFAGIDKLRRDYLSILFIINLFRIQTKFAACVCGCV